MAYLERNTGTEKPKNTMKSLLVFISLLYSNLTPRSALNIDTHTDDFKSLVLNNDAFVDKTLLIEEFLELSTKTFVPLIIRPRGWGKSTNINMLRRFFEIEVDDQGKRLPETETINDKLFLGGEILLTNSSTKKLHPLKISYSPKSRLMMGQMPVIFVKFENVTGQSYDEIEQSVKSRIMQAFQRHPYLTNYTYISPALFGEHDSKKYFDGNLNTTDLKRSLFILSGTLFEYFHRRGSVILIDDYDTPLINAFLKFGQNKKEYNKVVDLFDSMYGMVFKNNLFLHKGLMTGTLRLSFSTEDHSIANLDVLETCERFNRRFNQYYGFTRDEVKDLLERLPQPISVNVEQLNNWYGGYAIDEHIYLNGDLVMQCISQNGSLGYYEQSRITGRALIEKVFTTDRMQPKIQSLISGQKLAFNCFTHLMGICLQSLPEFDTLLHYGYLNKTNSLESPEVAIPNKQTQHIYEIKLLQWIATKFGTNTSQFISFALGLSNESMEQFRETLLKYLSNDAAAQLIKAGEKQSKAVYNAMNIALQTALSTSHEQITNGLTDGFVLIPKLGSTDLAIIFKYKTTKKQKEITSQAKSSIEEINNYLNNTNLKTYSHIRKINKIGLGLCGINAAVQNQIEITSSSNHTEGV